MKDLAGLVQRLDEMINLSGEASHAEVSENFRRADKAWQKFDAAAGELRAGLEALQAERDDLAGVCAELRRHAENVGNIYRTDEFGAPYFINERAERLEAERDAIAAAQWQPIETAPKDGSPFVIRREGEGFDTYEVGYYDPYYFARYEPAEGGLYRKIEDKIGDWRGFNNFHRATHWTPLPPPSAIRARGEAAQVSTGEEDGNHADGTSAAAPEKVNQPE